MSCYFRHIGDVLEGTGIAVTPANKKELDRVIHEFLHVEYKDCSTAWKTFKETVRDNAAMKKKLVAHIKKHARNL